MWRGYPFWVDAAGSCTIMNPLTKTTITTLPFEGSSTKQKLMGVSVGGDTPTFLNNIRILIGNSLPSYRYLELCPNGFDHDSPVVGVGANDINYYDLGGQEIHEGDTLTVTAVGTGAFSGVLHVDDLEGDDPVVPNGNYVMLKCGGTNDGANAVSATGGDLDSRKLENTRMYSLFKTELFAEDDSVEMVILQVGARTCAIPVGRMQWSKTPFRFSGLEWNNSQVIVYVQVAAGTKIDLRMHLIETQQQGQAVSENAPPIQAVTPSVSPGVLSIPVGVVSGVRRPPTKAIRSGFRL